MQEPKLIDFTIGHSLRRARKAAGHSLSALGPMINLSPQQIQKYETAQNRVPASTLWKFAEILNVQITYFFVDHPDNENSTD
jgi:transcriptional regulator with XRE-family HTH domain